MREILFRGKAINRDKGYHRTNYKNGDWVYGLITRLYDNQFPSLPAEMSVMGVSGIEVDYNTIGQYTGLTVSSGKIFEHDIVTAKFKNNGARFNFTVKYSYEKGGYVFDNGSIKVPFCDIRSVKIIGNIHDNPELLKGGE